MRIRAVGAGEKRVYNNRPNGNELVEPTALRSPRNEEDRFSDGIVPAGDIAG
jgi:hypothetical protein